MTKQKTFYANHKIVCLLLSVLVLAGCRGMVTEPGDGAAAMDDALMCLAVMLATPRTSPDENGNNQETPECDCTGGACTCGDDCACTHCRNESFTGERAIRKEARRVLWFTATWCAPCQRWKESELPLLERVGWEIEPVDIDHKPGLKERYQVKSVPTFVVLRGERELGRRTGGTDARTFARWVNRLRGEEN